MRSILLHAFDDDEFPQRLDAALDIARAFDAHLTILHAIPYEAGIPGDPYGASFAAMVPVWREGGKKLRAKTEADMANEDVPWDWVDGVGTAADALLRHSSLADLIIMGAREPRFEGKAPSSSAGELALSADCPVLVLPEGAGRIDLSRPAAIAWDGSAEASHALRASMPLLERASAIYLLYVQEGKGKKGGLDLPPMSGADYLSRHGLSAEISELECKKGNVAEALIAAATHGNAGLFVMGAYGKTRFSERIFGGVTREMLSRVPMPLLLTH